MSSSRAAFSGLKLNTLPMMEAVTFAIEPSSNNDKSYATQQKYWPGLFGTGSTRYAFARYMSHAVKRSVHTTVQVAVDDSPATAAAASIGSTPSCGVMRKTASTSVSFGT